MPLPSAYTLMSLSIMAQFRPQQGDEALMGIHMQSQNL